MACPNAPDNRTTGVRKGHFRRKSRPWWAGVSDSISKPQNACDVQYTKLHRTAEAKTGIFDLPDNPRFPEHNTKEFASADSHCGRGLDQACPGEFAKQNLY